MVGGKVATLVVTKKKKRYVLVIYVNSVPTGIGE